jgi:SIR2-like protein
MTPTSRWLLFLGAGASMAPPSRLPNFSELFAGVLRSIGWRSVGGRWCRPGYPSFAEPEIPAEVLFGTLRRFGVAFADAVAAALGGSEANAVHDVAARVLACGGAVWTTNIDLGVEAACREPPRRAGRTVPSRRTERVDAGVLAPLSSAGAGTLVKFHGTAEDPRTLAFTDAELLAPLADDAIRHLVGIAAGATVVVFGYRGADADLYRLLEEAFAAAKQILWFEPYCNVRREIEGAFPRSTITFIPPRPGEDGEEEPQRATAKAFFTLATDAAVAPDPVLAEEMLERDRLPLDVRLSIPAPPAIVHARLVERFGEWRADKPALRTARRSDAAHLRVRSLPAHIRWTRSRSLYGDGCVAEVVEWLAKHRCVLDGLRPPAARDYAITGASALRLQQRNWDRVEEFARWAVEHRGAPTDYYYLAYGNRYALRIDEARRAADAAEAGLSASGDPERHAGAVLEQGCASIYQGRFGDARRYAFELRQRTGRYAIPRWRAWGFWLDGIALCYQCDPDAASDAFVCAMRRFEQEGRPGPIADVHTGRVLADRVRLAVGREASPSTDLSDAEELGGRYFDDRALVLADVYLARDEAGEAERLLRRVADKPSCPVASVWADLGLAEVGRLRDDARAGDCFAELARFAAERGAHWLGAQAAIGLGLSGDARAAQIWTALPAELCYDSQDSPAGLGQPRVLWMMTT